MTDGFLVLLAHTIILPHGLEMRPGFSSTSYDCHKYGMLRTIITCAGKKQVQYAFWKECHLIGILKEKVWEMSYCSWMLLIFLTVLFIFFLACLFCSSALVLSPQHRPVCSIWWWGTPCYAKRTAIRVDWKHCVQQLRRWAVLNHCWEHLTINPVLSQSNTTLKTSALKYFREY